MNEFIANHWLISGIISIIIGLLMILHTYKYPEKEPTPIAADFGGYLSGGGFIVIGLYILIKSPIIQTPNSNTDVNIRTDSILTCIALLLLGIWFLYIYVKNKIKKKGLKGENQTALIGGSILAVVGILTILGIL